jgi:hypothetical protein
MKDEFQVNAGAPVPEPSSMFGITDGPWSHLLERLHLVRHGRVHSRPAVLWSIALTWVPLLVLSLVEGVAWSGSLQVPFLRDFLPYGQFLLAVPALIVAEAVIGSRLARAAAGLRRSEVLSPGDGPALDALLHRAASVWGGRTVNGLILLLTLGATVLSLFEVREWLTGGWQYVDDRTTLPGWWYLFVSLPVMRFLALRWLWRLLVWAWVLWRTARLDLQPRPVHPDRAGGLAFLGEAQVAFGWLVFACGVQLSCLVADRVFFEEATLLDFRAYLFAFVLIALVVLLLPLMAFLPKLSEARFDTLLFLSGRGFEGSGALDGRLRSHPDADLPATEVSGLADYGALFENARLMRPIPLEWRHIGVLVLAAVVPFVPLVFVAMPAQQVLRTLAQLLL